MTVHVKMRSLVQGVRFTVFSILDSFMSRHRDGGCSLCTSRPHSLCSTALKSLGSEFISGYIRLAEGEKDPRNLMLAFAIDRVIGVEFDISNYVEVRREKLLEQRYSCGSVGLL
jgi:DNA repair/transcription protein MET18/MMS19